MMKKCTNFELNAKQSFTESKEKTDNVRIRKVLGYTGAIKPGKT